MQKNQLAKTKSALNRYFEQPARHGLWLIALVLALIGAPFYADDSSRACLKTYRQDTVIVVGSAKIATEIVKEPAEREKGLSGRGCIGSNQAMLFSFEKMGTYPFWMKDMQFPIDILWLNAEFRVVHIEVGIEPSTYPKSFSNTEPAQYVLELQAGRSAELGLKIGSRLQL